MSVRPTIKPRKAARMVGKTLAVGNAAAKDSAFILSLRTDAEKSRYLSAVRSGLVAQNAWLERYAGADDQAYFFIDYEDDLIGMVRLYYPQGDSFCWGSWILKNTRPSQVAMESAPMGYAYAVDHLGFKAAHFDVRKGNERLWQFHERFGAQQTVETELDYFNKLDGDAIAASRERYQRFLNGNVEMVFQ